MHRGEHSRRGPCKSVNEHPNKHSPPTSAIALSAQQTHGKTWVWRERHNPNAVWPAALDEFRIAVSLFIMPFIARGGARPGQHADAAFLIISGNMAVHGEHPRPDLPYVLLCLGARERPFVLERACKDRHQQV